MSMQNLSCPDRVSTHFSKVISHTVDDMIQEDIKTFNIAIRLFPSCLSLSLGTSSSTVTIIDDDGTNNNMYISVVIVIIIIIVQWQ